MDVRGVFRYADGNGGTSGRGGNEGKKDQGRRVVEVWGSRIGVSQDESFSLSSACFGSAKLHAKISRLRVLCFSAIG